MSTSPSNQTIALMTVSVAATIGILYYLYSNRQRESAAAPTSYHGEEKGRTLAPASRTQQGPSSPTAAASSSRGGPSSSDDASASTGASYPVDKTPKITNTKSAEKDLHLRIEELDKRGKALFKSGQVRAFD
jgi:hypothetical protein